MNKVTSKTKQFVADDPLGRDPDPWAEFRDIEILELNWNQSYKHSLGKYSRFFIELENRRFFATRCPECGKVWAPPRPVCPEHLAITEWVELSGEGRLASFSVLHHVPAMAPHLEPPYVLAYVRLEGADTLFAHLLQNYGSLSDIYHDMPLQATYSDGPVDHPIMLMAFEPLSQVG